MKELSKLYNEAGQEFIDDLFKDYLVVTEKLSGSSLSFEKKGDGIAFYKGSAEKPINLIDRTIMVYYEKAIEYVKTATTGIMADIPDNWRFCFQYFTHNEPGVIGYTNLPKNHLVLTHIQVKNENGKIAKIIEDPRIIRDWANLLNVTPLLPFFKGYLTEKQKEQIRSFLSTPREDHLEVFKTSSFAEYILKILNPSVDSTILHDDLSQPIDSIIFKFYKPGSTQAISAKMIDPYTMNIMKEREPVDLRRVPADINEIMLLDLLAFIEERGLKAHEVLSATPEERYVELISNIFNDYVRKRGSDIKNIDIEKAKFASGDEFKLNIDIIPSQVTKNILTKNESLQDLFKIMLGSFRKKRNPDNAGNIMTPSVINDFNIMVDKIGKVVEKEDDGKFKTFGDYLKIKATNESLIETVEDSLYEELTLNYKDFTNLEKIVMEEAGKTLVKNKKTGDEYEVKNPDPKKHEIVEPKGKSNTDEPKESDSVVNKKVSELRDKMDKEMENIKDPDQKKNAEAVLSALDVINNPDSSKEEIVKEIEKLNDAGLIARNSLTAKSKKMYLNTAATGLPRKGLVPSTASPKELVAAMEEYGIENINPEGGRISRKDMTAAKIFGKDSVVSLDVKVTDNEIDFGGSKLTKTKIPSDEELDKIYKNKDEAKLAKKYLERRNKIIDEAMKSFKDGDMTIIEPVPNTPPTSPENRDKLKDATAIKISENFRSQFEKTGNKPTPGQLKLLSDFESLKDVDDPKEYEEKLNSLTEAMFKDPFFDTATTDVVEMVTYMSELNKGNAVYMPAASNYPLGDIISVSPEEIDFEKDSPEEIQRKIQLIYNGVEARSIKKNAGGASASGDKTNLSAFDEITNSKGEKISPADVKKDLTELSNKDGLYKEIYNGDPSKAADQIKKLSEKYDFDLDDPKFKESRDTSVQSAVNNIMKKCKDANEDEIRQNLESYYNLGNMYESVYNNTVNEQLFVNEQYKYTKSKGLEVNRTDGVTKMAKLKFSFSTGSWGCNGRPGNPVPTRFVNEK